MTAIKERGEVAIKGVGDGTYILRFSNRNLIEIETEKGKRWLTEFTQNLMSGETDVEMLEFLARTGIKDAAGKPVKDLPDDAFDKMTVLEFANLVLDGVFVSVHGQTFAEYTEETAKKIAKLREEGKDPPASSPDMTTLETSDEELSGQDAA